MRNLNPMAKIAISALFFGGVMLLGMYVRDVLLEHQAFNPNWFVVLAGMLLYVAASLLRK